MTEVVEIQATLWENNRSPKRGDFLSQSDEAVESLEGGLPGAAAGKRRSYSRRIGRTPEKMPAHLPLVDLDVPCEPALEPLVQVRSVNVLSLRQKSLFRKAYVLLASGGGVLTLTQKGDMQLRGLGVFEALLARSWGARFDDPEETFHLARVAVELAESFSPKSYGAKCVADLQARAWGELANAYRVSDRLAFSEYAFGKAFGLLNKGTDNLYLKARLFDLESSLLGDRREFALALQRLEILPDFYLGIGEPHLASVALIKKAIYTSYAGNSEDAICINRQGIDLVDRERNPTILMTAVHNQLLFLVDCQRFGQAKRVLFENRCNFMHLGRVTTLKLRWLEGRINYGLRELESAEIVFREVVRDFDKLSLAFAAALSRLDLAIVLMCQNRIEAAEQEVLKAQKVFLRLEIPREYLSSVILLEFAFKARRATTELLESVVADIRRKEILGVQSQG